MNPAPAALSVLVVGKFACIKIAGRATMASSVDFAALLTGLTRQKYTRFVFDLSECTLMDSTFLGLLAGFGLKLSLQTPDGVNQPAELLNPNGRVLDVLEGLGVLGLFKTTTGPLAIPEGAEIRAHSPLSPTREEVTRTCLEAHKTLMDINPDNIPKFKEVAEFLARDLKKLEGDPGDPS